MGIVRTTYVDDAVLKDSITLDDPGGRHAAGDEDTGGIGTEHERLTTLRCVVAGGEIGRVDEGTVDDVVVEYPVDVGRVERGDQIVRGHDGLWLRREYGDRRSSDGVEAVVEGGGVKETSERHVDGVDGQLNTLRDGEDFVDDVHLEVRGVDWTGDGNVIGSLNDLEWRRGVGSIGSTGENDGSGVVAWESVSAEVE